MRGCVKLIGVLLLSLPAGCGPMDSGGPSADVGSVEDRHGIPPHKPTSFADAVTQLNQRHQQLLEAPNGEHTQEQFQQLSDIVRWLPELAAETDLPRADWEAVQRLTRQLEQELAGWQLGGSVRPPADVARFHEQAGELDRLVVRARELDRHSPPPVPADEESTATDEPTTEP
jgi:hypothetical protein